MKNKIIFPVMIMVWVTGFFVISGALILFNNTLKSEGISSVQTIHYAPILYKLTGILLLGSFIIYMVLSKVINKITFPIEQLTKDAESFATGKYTHHLRDYDIDELQKLAGEFDRMGEELNGTIRKLRHQKTKVEAVLAALDEGIVVVDKEGQIKEMNQLVMKMLKLKSEGFYKNHITNIIRDDKFKTLVQDAFEKVKYGSLELTLSDKTIYITIASVGKTDKVYEYLIVLRDITKLKNLEEMKYQFVSNVSHELKTPLTSIQGFVETLKEGAIEDKNVALRFLDIIDVEAKRLYRLIQDILLLSEIENMPRQEYGTAEVNAIIEHVIDIVKEEAVRKSIEIIFDSQEEVTLPNTSPDHIEQIMLNLISNAVKYTDHGHVVINAAVKQNKLVICVEDTGIGIPKESIPHIFERFYRVDKGRSRKSGGTGLGLSIVKHIAQLYDAQIDVVSQEGKGSAFTLSFKIEYPIKGE